MATTKIWAIKSTPNLALDYITDELKTDYKNLISGFNVTPETAAIEFAITRDFAKNEKGSNKATEKILAHHLVQSFKPGESTPEQAHEIGQKLADEILQGKYEYVISTHVDKGHIHNHIIINSVSFVDFKKLNPDKKFYHNIRKQSDLLCKEHSLSVIEKPKGKGKHYHEWSESKKGTSWKDKLKISIDENISAAKTFDDFLALMSAKGYNIKQGKHLAFQAPGQERFTRAKTLGENYSEEKIRDRINVTKTQKQFRKVSEHKYFGSVESINKKDLALNALLKISQRNNINKRNKGRTSRASYIAYKQNSINKLSEQLLYISKNNLTNLNSFTEKINSTISQLNDTKQTLIKAEHKINNLQELVKYINTCSRYAEIYNQYQNKKGIAKASFENTNPEVGMYLFALKKLKENNLFEHKQFIEAINLYEVSKNELEVLKENYNSLNGELRILNEIKNTIFTSRKQSENVIKKDIRKNIEIS